MMIKSTKYKVISVVIKTYLYMPQTVDTYIYQPGTTNMCCDKYRIQ